MIAPVELINSTIGTDTKFVPAKVNVVFVLGAIVILEDVIVGFVSTASMKLKVPEPFVDNTWPFVPVLFGKISV